MQQRTYTQEEQNEITNNYNKVVIKAQGNEHTLDDMKAVVAYNQMQLVLQGKPRWVASVAKEKPPKKEKVVCGKCGLSKSKCPYKTKERPNECLALQSKKVTVQEESNGVGEESPFEVFV